MGISTCSKLKSDKMQHLAMLGNILCTHMLYSTSDRWYLACVLERPIRVSIHVTYVMSAGSCCCCCCWAPGPTALSSMDTGPPS